MNRNWCVILGGVLFGALGLGSAIGFATLRSPANRPDLERLLMVALPALWAVAGVVLSLWVSGPSADGNSGR